MSAVVYIDRKGSTLEADSGRLLIHVPGRPTASMPWRQLESIVLLTAIDLPASLLNRLGEHDIALLNIPKGKDAEPLCCYSFRHGHAIRRLNQARMVDDPSARVAIMRRILSYKIGAQRRQLLRIANKRQGLAPKLRLLADQLTGLRRDVVSYYDLKAETALGIEGAAARAYFEGLALAIPPALAFNGRNRRPPRDPFNALLSLGYTLLQHDAVRALVAVGLDPALGFLHSPAYGRDSLGCDLTELLRAHVDHFCWRLVATETLREHHFSQDGEACLLNKNGRVIFFPLWERFMRHQRRLLRGIAKRLAGEVDRYRRPKPPCLIDGPEQGDYLAPETL